MSGRVGGSCAFSCEVADEVVHVDSRGEFEGSPAALEGGNEAMVSDETHARAGWCVLRR
jgi:hypothetical protein